jgi:hypothetical protein
VHVELSRRVSTDERVASLLEARSVLHDSSSSVGALELVDRELDLLDRWVATTWHADDCACAASMAVECCMFMAGAGVTPACCLGSYGD